MPMGLYSVLSICPIRHTPYGGKNLIDREPVSFPRKYQWTVSRTVTNVLDQLLSSAIQSTWVCNMKLCQQIKKLTTIPSNGK